MGEIPGLRLAQSRSRRGFCPDVHNGEQWPQALVQRLRLHQRSKIAAQTQLTKNRSYTCTKFRHPPVDELHSIETKRDKIAKKELTYKTGASKNTLVL